MKDWKSIVRAVAPTLATALGSPVSGMATKLIVEGLLGKSEATDSELATALMDPDNLVKLKSIELDFEVKMKELDIDIAKISVDDRKSARALAENTSTRPQVVISTVFIVGFFAVLWVLFSGEVELTESMEKLAFLLLGVLSSGVTMVLKFWFGGSPNDSAQMQNIYNSIPSENLKRK